MDKKMQADLDSNRKEWEGGANVIAFKESLSAGCYVSLVFNDNGWINVFRYFFLGDTCHVSCEIDTQDERNAWLKYVEHFN